MKKYYCKCLNICVELGNDIAQADEPLNLSDEEKKDPFFVELPLLFVRDVKVKTQQPTLVRSKRVGVWDVYKCTNCSTYSHAIENENSNATLMNKLLLQLPDDEVENIKKSIDYSPVFHVVVSDNSLFDGNLLETSHLNERFSSDIVELQKQLSNYVDQKNKVTEQKIREYVEQQQAALKKLVKRANEDFQILTNIIMKSEGEQKPKNEIKSSPYAFTDTKSYTPVDISTDSVINDFENMTCGRKCSFLDKSYNMPEIPPSFDSEGLFPLDGMEVKDVLDEDEHSEDDLSDTDDSGSRDEGIHIPRCRSFTVAKSLPIRVPSDYDPSFRLNEPKRDSKKPNYQQKRNDRPLDIAASIKALANSVHGDNLFGDLPRPRTDSKI